MKAISRCVNAKNTINNRGKWILFLALCRTNVLRKPGVRFINGLKCGSLKVLSTIN